MTLFLHGTSTSDLQKLFVEKGEKPFRVKQLLHWVYTKGVTDWEKMTDFSQSLRQNLPTVLALSSLRLVQSTTSEDQETTKFLWELADGQLVESVLILSEERRTVCVSSQVGCPARCSFCASGKMGLMRNLSTSEIVEQVYAIDLFLREKQERVSHVVFMGMGEPFENYDAVVQAIRFLTDAERFNISQRRITVSTVGVVEAIKRFTQEDFKVHLVLSLHAPTQEIRRKIIPYARKYALEDVLEAMLQFARATKRDITYEYTLLKGINDQPEHAHALAKLLRGHPCTVNLIPYNPVLGIRLHRPEKEVIADFRSILLEAGVPATQRYTKGKDIAAACGQLALIKKEQLLTI